MFQKLTVSMKFFQLFLSEQFLLFSWLISTALGF